jgi:hypothetical protein
MPHYTERKEADDEAFYVIGSESDRLRCILAVDKLDKAKTVVWG